MDLYDCFLFDWEPWTYPDYHAGCTDSYVPLSIVYHPCAAGLSFGNVWQPTGCLSVHDSVHAAGGFWGCTQCNAEGTAAVRDCTADIERLSYPAILRYRHGLDRTCMCRTFTWMRLCSGISSQVNFFRFADHCFSFGKQWFFLFVFYII